MQLFAKKQRPLTITLHRQVFHGKALHGEGGHLGRGLLRHDPAFDEFPEDSHPKVRILETRVGHARPDGYQAKKRRRGDRRGGNPAHPRKGIHGHIRAYEATCCLHEPLYVVQVSRHAEVLHGLVGVAIVMEPFRRLEAEAAQFAHVEALQLVSEHVQEHGVEPIPLVLVIAVHDERVGRQQPVDPLDRRNRAEDEGKKRSVYLLEQGYPDEKVDVIRRHVGEDVAYEIITYQVVLPVYWPLDSHCLVSRYCLGA